MEKKNQTEKRHEVRSYRNDQSLKSAKVDERFRKVISDQKPKISSNYLEFQPATGWNANATRNDVAVALQVELVAVPVADCNAFNVSSHPWLQDRLDFRMFVDTEITVFI